MRRLYNDVIPILLITAAVAIFFGRFLFPEPKLLVTPDYGRSDAWHFSMPTKFALSETTPHLGLPLWRSDMGGGFPLFAEGQTGALFLPNIIAFGLLPPVTAYTIVLAGTVWLLGLGTYFLIRTLGMGPLAGLFASVTIMFSGLTMPQLTHITLLQGMSLLPLVTLLSVRLSRTPTVRTAAVLSLIVAQQIFAGFPQASFLSVLFGSGYIAFGILYGKTSWKPALYWIGGVGAGIAAGAAQILPSWEFLRASTDPAGFSPTVATMFSMPIKHLVSLILPFALGTPRDGSYPPFYAFDGSIFWENTMYLGWVPILLVGCGVLLRKTTALQKFLWLTVGSTLLLAGGKYTPTYILFSVWPMTLFRVPSRFLWITAFAVIILAAHALHRISEAYTGRRFIRIALAVILLAHTYQVISAWWGYHLLEPAAAWLSPPASVPYLAPGRVLTIAEGVAHNRLMTRTGWTAPSGFYDFRNGISPNSNMYWNIPQVNVYAGRFLERQSITSSLLSEAIAVKDGTATVSASRTLDLFQAANVISFVPLDAPTLTKTETPDVPDSIGVYRNAGALPRAYMVFEATTAATVREAVLRMTDTAFVPGRTVLLERHETQKHPELSPFIGAQNKETANAESGIRWLTDEHERVELTVTAQSPALLVLADTYYPGWTADIDGKPTDVFAANISQRAIAVPRGTHRVRFRYQPASVRTGMNISIIAGMVIMTLAAVPFRVPAVRTPKTDERPGKRRPRSRRRSLR